MGVSGQASVRPSVAQACGLYSEANAAGTACTCVAGYEQALSGGGSRICAPCLSGTVRARRAVGGCVPCPADNRSTADFMGMAGCVCRPEYRLADDGRACLLPPPPWDVMGLLTPTVNVATAAAMATAAVLALVGALACALL